jgi:co-chaperonin GroES (HSP10)
MAKNVLEPAGEFVLVLDVPVGTTIDGIELPDNVRAQEMIYGRVVFTGPAVSPYTHIEDIVCYGPYAGKTIVFEGVQFRILKEGQIELYVRKVEGDKL